MRVSVALSRLQQPGELVSGGGSCPCSPLEQRVCASRKAGGRAGMSVRIRRADEGNIDSIISVVRLTWPMTYEFAGARLATCSVHPLVRLGHHTVPA